MQQRLDDEVWIKETRRRWGLVCKYFKKRNDILAVEDFITTAKNVSREEAETQTPDSNES